ncbi:MAG: peptide chain release factor N(5)-glutamine methyltransferase [Gemmatimonadota bacterium]
MRNPDEPGGRGGESPPRRPAAPSRREVVRGLTAELRAAGMESPDLEAKRLVAWALGIELSDLAVTGGEMLGPEEAGRLARAVGRRLSREPLQHIEGTAAFRDLTLVSDARALIPRPETEELIDRIAAWVGQRAPLPAALDIGTGSGAIALALLTEGLAETVVGLDPSESALRQARQNRGRAGVPAWRFELRHIEGPVWDAVEANERFDLIVSNPPYVARDALAALAPEVRDHEPRLALEGGADGLDVLREIVGGAGSRVLPGGALFLEIGADQGERVRDLLKARREWGSVRVQRDLAGRDRFVRALRG